MTTWQSAVVVILLLGTCGSAAAQREANSLKGINAVVFRVNSYGSKSQPVTYEFEGALRGAGIKLLSSDGADMQVPHLDLDLTLACDGPSCSYTVRLQMSQRVRLSRRLTTECMATTWADGYQNGISESALPSLMDLYIADSKALIKSFVDDYRSASKGAR